MRLLCSPFSLLILSLATQAQTPELDSLFDAGSSSDGLVLSVAVQDDGRIIVGGRFNTFQGDPYVGVVRLTPDGVLDPSFMPVPFVDNVDVNVIAIDTAGRILLGGDFLDFDGTSMNGIARLLTDGTRDTSFDPGTGTDNYVGEIILQPDGKILIGGEFNTVDGLSFGGIARLNSDGSVDTTFDPGTGFSASWDPDYTYVNCLGMDQQGRILVAGGFDTFDGAPINQLVRLTPEGVLDDGFAPELDDEVWDVLILDDQRIRIAGYFTEVNGQFQSGIAGLLPDGASDPLFIQGAPVEAVNDLTLDGEGILLVGFFESYLGQPHRNMARIDVDGGLDLGFNVEEGFGEAPYLHAMRRQADGKVLVFGDFDSYNGTERIDVLRLLPSGEIVDCNGVSGGSDLPGTPCDDGDENTGDDTWNTVCECIGTPLIFDCTGVLDGPDMPGEPCDDLNPSTTNDVWSTECECSGTPPAPDCAGVPGGPDTPGTSCDDGILFTTNDTWTEDCECSGFDCAGLQGGTAFPGTPCDDGISWTYNDTWTATCACQGVGMIGLAEQQDPAGDIILWPNPSDGDAVHIWLGLPSGSTARIAITDAAGRIYQSHEVIVRANHPVIIYPTDLSTGTYLVSVTTGQGSIVRLLVVQ